MKEISKQEVLERLRARKPYGTLLKDLAAEFDVSVAFMSAVLRGQKRIPDSMLGTIGVERRVAYYLVKETPLKTRKRE
jgi:hypothetical protein